MASIHALHRHRHGRPSRRLRCLHRFFSKSKLRRRRIGLVSRRGTRPNPRSDTRRELTETALRNVALEAVRVGNYYAEDQEEVLRYIAEIHDGLLRDQSWLRKTRSLWRENGLTRKYTVPEILRKAHEADGFDVFVEADEAILTKEREEAKAKAPSGAAWEPPPGLLAELREGLGVLAAWKCGGALGPVGVDEVTELLEGCSKAGEVAAAVFCGERLLELHGGDLPRPLLERTFQALKPLLRPSAMRAKPQLVGPWMQPLLGQLRAPNSRKKLGLLLEHLARARREHALGAGDGASEKAELEARRRQSLARLCDILAPLLAEDDEAKACRRRGPLVHAAARVCREQGLEASTRLAWIAVQEMERRGEVEAKNRDVGLREAFPVGAAQPEPAGAASSATAAAALLRALSADLPLLEAAAKESMERRKRRREAKERGKAAKRAKRG